MTETKHQLAQFSRDATVRAESFNADDSTVEIVWTTGASVRRYSWLDGEEYDECLSLEAGAVRLERLNLGAPFLDTHCSYDLASVIGSVVPGTADIKDGRGTATVKLSKAAGVADTVQKIQEAVIRNVSVGYWIHKVVKTESQDGKIARWDVVDWEPLEISAVPVPADPGSQIRSVDAARASDGAPATRFCTFITHSASAPSEATKEKIMATRTPNGARAPKSAAAKRLAELEAENKKLVEQLATARAAADDDKAKDDDDERDADVADEENAADDCDKDKDTDEGREADDGDDGDDDTAEKEDKDERSAATAKVIREAADAAVRRDRERQAEIRSLAKQMKDPALGERHAEKGTSVKRFKEIVLARLLKSQDSEEAIRGVAGDPDVVRERNGRAPSSEERQAADGAAHWRKISGKAAA